VERKGKNSSDVRLVAWILTGQRNDTATGLDSANGTTAGNDEGERLLDIAAGDRAGGKGWSGRDRSDSRGEIVGRSYPDGRQRAAQALGTHASNWGNGSGDGRWTRSRAGVRREVCEEVSSS
jgi:hypothetical protein